MKTLATVTLIILIGFVNLQAQRNPRTQTPAGNGVIKGTVVDSATNTAMAYTTIAVIDSKSSQVVDGVASKTNGDFLIDGLPLGEYDLKLSFMGYQTDTIKGITLSSDNPLLTLPSIKMKAKSIENAAVEVFADKESITYKLDRRIINISENPNVRGGRLADALQNTPSINVDTEGNVTIRGSSNFEVLIDGKPSPMSGNEALKMIPADAVENVELITNPSAKYDPEGSVGIVNIITKKIDMNGINGIINTSAGIKDKYSADGTFNYRYDDFNFYTGLVYQSMIFKPWSDYTRETYSKITDTINIISPYIDRNMKSNSITGTLGIEYTIDESRYASLSSNVYYTDFLRGMPTKLRAWTNPTTTDNYYLNDDVYTVNGYYSTINSYFQQNFEGKGHQISATINAIIWDGGGYELSSKTIADKNYNIIDQNVQQNKGTADSRSFMIKCKSDYVYPIGEGYNFEAGYNFDYTQDFSDYLYENFNNNTKKWETNSNFTNNTKYYHSINAVYSTFSGMLFDFNYQLGLRAEYFNRRLQQETGNSLYKYDKVSFFPTFHLTKQFENDQQIQLSYSRRVQRPDVYALNPFPDYVDDYVVSMGNPNLMPEFTDSYELNYQKSFEGLFLSLQTYYRYTDNAISRVLKVGNDKKVWITSENVSNSTSYGAELSANITLAKNFRINLNGSYFNYKMESDDATVDGNMGGNSFNGNVMLFYTLEQSTVFQVNAFYMGTNYTIDGKVNDTYSLGFSIRHFLLDRALTLFLNGRNILNSVKYESINRRDTYYFYGTTYAEGANISLGFSLNINNYQNKVRPEDEVERTNVGSSGGY